MNAAEDVAMKRVYRRVCGSIMIDLERLEFGCDRRCVEATRLDGRGMRIAKYLHVVYRRP